MIHRSRGPDLEAACQRAAAADGITVMRAHDNRRMTKLHRADGTCGDYDLAYRYDAATVPLNGLVDILRLLHRLLPLYDRCVVRGALAGGERTYGIRRLAFADKKTGDAATLADVPRRWLALDWDGIALPHDVDAADLASCGRIAIDTMPAVFRDAACIVQASANHGIKPGVRLRGWFWCDRPLIGREIKRWLANTPCDPSVWAPAQPIYTAAPTFAPGRTEHMPSRLLMLPGADCLVCPSPEDLADPPPKPRTPPERIARGAHANAYVDAALSGAADAIIGAGEGKRHPTIIRESRSLARLIEAGLLSESDLIEVLTRAAEMAGKDCKHEIQACIAWGIANPSKGKLPEAANAAN